MSVQPLHPSEAAPLTRQAINSPASGSIEEFEALAAIDRARLEDLFPVSAATARRRARKHWSDRGHQLGY